MRGSTVVACCMIGWIAWAMDGARAAEPVGVQRVNTSAKGVQARGETAQPGRLGISDDGRVVLFDSRADNLVPKDQVPAFKPLQGYGVYRKDLQTGEIRNLWADLQSFKVFERNSPYPGTWRMSGDARTVVMLYYDTWYLWREGQPVRAVPLRVELGRSWDMDRGSFALSRDGRWAALYGIREQDGAKTAVLARVDLAHPDAPVEDAVSFPKGGYEYRPAVSADGSKIAFLTNNPLADDDTNGVDDVYLWDAASKQARRLTVNERGIEADGKTLGYSLSPDGRYLAVITHATNLVPETEKLGHIRPGVVLLLDTQANKWALVAKPASHDTYGFALLGFSAGSLFWWEATNNVFQGGGPHVIGRRHLADGKTEMIQLLDIKQGDYGMNARIRREFSPVAVSRDGTSLLVSSTMNELVENDTNNARDLFVYRLPGEPEPLPPLAVPEVAAAPAPANAPAKAPAAVPVTGLEDVRNPDRTPAAAAPQAPQAPQASDPLPQLAKPDLRFVVKQLAVLPANLEPARLAVSPDRKRYALFRPNNQPFVEVDGERHGCLIDFAPGSLRFTADSGELTFIGLHGGKSFLVRQPRGQGQRLGTERWSAMGEPTFSPDGKRFGYAAERDGKRYMVIDGAVQGPYDSTTPVPLFSDNSKSYVYLATQAGKPVLVHDGQVKPGPDQAGQFRISPDGARLVWSQQVPGGWVLVDDGKPTEPLAGVGGVVFSRDGKRMAYAALRADGQSMVIDGSEQKRYRGIHPDPPVFSRDGSRFAYGTTNADRTAPVQFVVENGTEHRAYQVVKHFRYSPDGTRLGYLAADAVGTEREAWFLVVDGKEYPRHTGIASYAFSPDGRHVAYWANAGGRRDSAGQLTGGEWTLYVDGHPVSRPFDYCSGQLLWSADSAYLVTEANRGGQPLPASQLSPEERQLMSAEGIVVRGGTKFAVVNGQELANPTGDGIPLGAGVLHDDGFYAMALRGNKLLRSRLVFK